MGSYRDKLTKQARDYLEDGESIVAGARCLPKGLSGRRALGGVFGVMGVLAAGQSTGSTSIIGGRPLSKNLALALTNRRLLIFKVSEVTDKATELTHSVPIADVTGFHFEIGKSFAMKAVYMEFALADGSLASLEAVRPNTADGEALAHALSGVVRPGAGPCWQPGIALD